MAFPESFQNQTQQNELQKEHCVKENRGMDKDNPKLPQTGKTTIIHVALRHYYSATSLMLKLNLPILSFPRQTAFTTSPRESTSSTLFTRSLAIFEI